ncbi:MAG: hypothetical protein EXQ56_05345 [Acidobacteria bacterium]|nr:hypothetical protein [Acidobacteriota bacterium]
MITLFTGRAPARALPAEDTKPASNKESSAPKKAETPATDNDVTLQKVGELDRLREENGALKKKLDEERQLARVQLGQMEVQGNELRSTADKVRGERGDIEARAAVLRKSVTALERQVQDEREKFNKELERTATQRDTLMQEVAELNECIVTLEKDQEETTLSNTRSTTMGLSTEIGASHAHISRLESLVQRLEDEVENSQREFATEKEKSRRTADEWEAKLKQSERAVSQAHAERQRIEGSASMVQMAVEALEQQVREQREAMECQAKLMDSERSQARARSGEQEQKILSLQAQLEAASMVGSIDDNSDTTVTALDTALTETLTHSALAESRILLLDGELEATRNQVLKEAESSAERIKKFEARWEEVQQQLLPKDQELTELRPLVNQLKAQVKTLKAALAKGQAQAQAGVAGAASGTENQPFGFNDPTFAQTGVRLPADIAEPFYHQTMAPITVMLACADILNMSKKVDPSLKSTVAEFKTQTQTLLDLIKRYTLPPDSKAS